MCKDISAIDQLQNFTHVKYFIIKRKLIPNDFCFYNWINQCTTYIHVGDANITQNGRDIYRMRDHTTSLTVI